MNLNINWKARLNNKFFWIAMISALALLAQAVGKCFGLELDLSDLEQNLIGVVNALFGVLAVAGVVMDGTTDGFGDSDRAMTYCTEYDVRLTENCEASNTDEEAPEDGC